MPDIPPHDLTLLIQRARDGDPRAKHELFDRIYHEFHAMARRRMAERGGGGVGQRGNGTLQPTALVHELFIDLERRFPAPPLEMRESRATFLQSAGLAMKTLLRNHCKKRATAKRGGGRRATAILDDEPADSGIQGCTFEEVLALDEAMDRLERFNQRWHRVVITRFYAGKSTKETAEAMGVGVTTVKDEWKLAKGWLHREIEGRDNGR